MGLNAFSKIISSNDIDEDDGTDEDTDTDEDEDDDKEMGEDLVADRDKDVYAEYNQWGILYTDESGGIFKPIVNAVGKQSANISHEFAITAWECSIKPEIREDVKQQMTGYHHIAIEKCIRCLLSHDINAEEDDEIDEKVDLFWDEFSAFQKM